MADETNDTVDGKSERDILDMDLDDTPEEKDETTDDESSEESDETKDETENSEDEDESDDESDEDDSEEDESDTDEDDEELDEIDEDDETESESDEDLSLYQAVKKENKDLFKKFPQLKDAIFRDEKFSKSFATPEEAESGANALKIYGRMEQDLVEGNLEPLLNSLETTDKNAYENFVHNLLPSVEKKNKELYGEILAKPFKLALRQAFASAEKAGNKNLKLAAQYISDFFFDDKGDMDNIPKGREKKESKEDDGLKKRETEFEDRRLNTFLKETNEIVTYRTGKIIAESISKLELSPYERRNLTNDIMNEIDAMIAKDSRHMSTVDSIRKQARSGDYSGDWKSRLANTYLARAKAVIEIAKKRALDKAEIKGGSGSKKKEAKRLSPSGSTSGGNTKLRAKDIDWNKTSERDILNDKITLKTRK
jgi:hypothetical protein